MRDFIFTATGDSISRRIHGLNDADLAELTALIKQADAAFTNLELVTPREPVIPSPEFGGIHLGMPPYVLDELRQTGFNLYNLAHNHAIDFTISGLLDTLEELAVREMVVAGAGRDLGGARSPAYLQTEAGRVALVAAASTYMPSALAAETRTDFAGRPGINPLRFKTEYVMPAEQLGALKQMDEALGTAAVTRKKQEFGLDPKAEADEKSYKFLKHSFVEGTSPGVRTKLKERDAGEICRWITDARRQADFVVMSLHCHEGQSGDTNTNDIADFIVEAAHRFIDAGADVFVGHGPHLLRGIEIYKGKPIFYSLGNFMFQCENIARLPAEMYELYDMPASATPADVFDFESVREDGTPNAFHADPAFWQTVLPICRFRGGQLVAMELHPITLNLERGRTQRGIPALASPEEGQTILAQLARLCEPFGTTIAIETRGARVIGRLKN